MLSQIILTPGYVNIINEKVLGDFLMDYSQQTRSLWYVRVMMGPKEIVHGVNTGHVYVLTCIVMVDSH